MLRDPEPSPVPGRGDQEGLDCSDFAREEEVFPGPPDLEEVVQSGCDPGGKSSGSDGYTP